MTDRPIIFSGPMVQALLAGRKTQTRRVLKPPYGTLEYLRDGTWKPICTKFFPGDRLYVREAFIGPYAYEVNEYPPRDWGNKAIWFPADGPVPEAPAKQFWHRARPSIHMPRWASRLTLIVTDVRVQRLQDISEADAVAEGCGWSDMWEGYTPCPQPGDCRYFNSRSATDSFAQLWGGIHDPDAWDENPWVVALTFTVHRGNIDTMEVN